MKKGISSFIKMSALNVIAAKFSYRLLVYVGFLEFNIFVAIVN